MTTPVLSAYESDRLDSALSKMERNGVRRLTLIDATGSVTGELGKLVSLLAYESEKEVERRT